jgi:ribosome assembly protein RRB1
MVDVLNYSSLMPTLWQVWDLNGRLAGLASADADASQSRPMKTDEAPKHAHVHKAEGFAMDWSRVMAGRLVVGDVAKQIHVWEPSTSGDWAVGGAYAGHRDSVEDVQWSPTEATVFASCSADKTIRIWDTRQSQKSMISVVAHGSDVNVISWNRSATYMLVSGADDGSLRVWDLRSLSADSFVANFAYHRCGKPAIAWQHFSLSSLCVHDTLGIELPPRVTAARLTFVSGRDTGSGCGCRGSISSVEWCPWESSMLASTAGDGQVVVWDLALERDPEEEARLAPSSNAIAPEDLPPQLLFVHLGQTDVKEVHWHPQIPGMLASTAADGFNIFKPANV